jgi:hypothetical protein
MKRDQEGEIAAGCLTGCLKLFRHAFRGEATGRWPILSCFGYIVKRAEIGYNGVGKERETPNNEKGKYNEP